MLATTTATTTDSCTFSNPISYDGTAPTLKTHQFYFQNSTCVARTVAESTTTLPATQATTSTSSSPITSSSSILFLGQMTAGELMISFLLFLGIVLYLTTMIPRALSKIKTSKTFMAYSGGEVEIRENL